MTSIAAKPRVTSLAPQFLVDDLRTRKGTLLIFMSDVPFYLLRGDFVVRDRDNKRARLGVGWGARCARR